jgi:hypothetical protein
VEAISRIIILIRQREDKPMWIHDHKGVFTVKYAYKLNHDNSNGSNASFEWQRIWKLKAHERTKMLIWRIGANVLPTKERIAQRMSISDTSYSCAMPSQNQVHIFSLIVRLLEPYGMVVAGVSNLTVSVCKVMKTL